MWWLANLEKTSDLAGTWLYIGEFYAGDLLPWGTELASVCDALEHYAYDMAVSFHEGSVWGDGLELAFWDIWYGDLVRQKVEEAYNLEWRLDLQNKFNVSTSLTLSMLADRIDSLAGTGLPLPSLEDIIRSVLAVPADIVFATFDVFIDHLEDFLLKRTDWAFEMARLILLKLI